MWAVVFYSVRLRRSDREGAGEGATPRSTNVKAMRKLAEAEGLLRKRPIET